MFTGSSSQIGGKNNATTVVFASTDGEPIELQPHFECWLAIRVPAMACPVHPVGELYGFGGKSDCLQRVGDNSGEVTCLCKWYGRPAPRRIEYTSDRVEWRCEGPNKNCYR